MKIKHKTKHKMIKCSVTNNKNLKEEFMCCYCGKNKATEFVVIHTKILEICEKHNKFPVTFQRCSKEEFIIWKLLQE